MGPITLFDKSFLQSLSTDESVWFDHFFYSVVCPIFYVETLADLSKGGLRNRTPDQEVRFIAEKFPEIHGTPCSHHDALCVASLLGNSVPMDGRIPIAGGRIVKVGGKKGMVVDRSPESTAFSRWQRQEFKELEREFARSWRVSLASMDLAGIASGLRSSGIDPKLCRSLDEARDLADLALSNIRTPIEQLYFASLFFSLPSKTFRIIHESWKSAGEGPLAQWAPYAWYVLRIELFFHIALAANHISTERLSNRQDIAYLYYLPFGHIFVSSDRLHRRCAHLFMRPDQEFVWGEDLKADLRSLNAYFQGLTEEVKERGIMEFAAYPPEDGNHLVSALWDRHLSPWRGRVLDRERTPKNPEKDRKIVEELRLFTQAQAVENQEPGPDLEDFDVVSIQRYVRKRKGQWYQVPKDLKIEDADE